MKLKIASKLIFKSCVWYSNGAYYGICVFIKDIGRRLPWNYSVSCTRVNRVMITNLCVEAIKTVFDENKI